MIDVGIGELKARLLAYPERAAHMAVPVATLDGALAAAAEAEGIGLFEPPG
jgi:hypothetical protein